MCFGVKVNVCEHKLSYTHYTLLYFFLLKRGRMRGWTRVVQTNQVGTLSISFKGGIRWGRWESGIRFAQELTAVCVCVCVLLCTQMLSVTVSNWVEILDNTFAHKRMHVHSIICRQRHTSLMPDCRNTSLVLLSLALCLVCVWNSHPLCPEHTPGWVVCGVSTVEQCALERCKVQLCWLNTDFFTLFSYVGVTVVKRKAL